MEVRVPVQPRQLKLTIGKNIPAGQGINHRCLVASHCLEVLAITQVFVHIVYPEEGNSLVDLDVYWLYTHSFLNCTH